MTENEVQNTSEISGDVLKSAAFKELLFCLLKGISIFANRARIASSTNATVDRFVAESLSLLTGEHTLDIDAFRRLVERALAVRANAHEMYARSLAEKQVTQGELPKPATMEFLTDKESLIALAYKMGGIKATLDPKVIYWQSVCMDRIAAIGGIVAAEESAAEKEYDVSGFIHKALDYLARDLSSVELLAMADQLETARMKIVNALLAGDTLVEIPAPRITLSDIKSESD